MHVLLVLLDSRIFKSSCYFDPNKELTPRKKGPISQDPSFRNWTSEATKGVGNSNPQGGPDEMKNNCGAAEDAC